MLKNFLKCFFKSRLSIDDLEVLTPDQLGELLLAEVRKNLKRVGYIQDLIAVGCPLDVRDRYGWAPLHRAANDRNFKLVKLLISNGALVNYKTNREGWTALHLAAFSRCSRSIKFLISNGADINARNNKGQTAWSVTTLRIREAFPELKPK